MFEKILPKKIQLIIGVGSLILLLIIFLAAGFIFLDKKRNEFRTLHSPEKAEKEAKNLVAKVSQIYLLPDELPTVATVTDKSKLSGQEFFTKAKEGDKVLIFPQNKLVILYRLSANKIIEVAPLPEPSPVVSFIASSSGALGSPSAPKIIFKKENASGSGVSVE